MEKLIKMHHDLVSVLTSYEIALNCYANFLKSADLSDRDQHEHADMLRDSVVQRFKYCFELTWKYLALYMEQKEQMQIPVISPRSIFRTACAAQLITEQEAVQSQLMADDRNKTSHMYREEVADLIARAAPEHFKLMHEFCKRFKS